MANKKKEKDFIFFYYYYGQTKNIYKIRETRFIFIESISSISGSIWIHFNPFQLHFNPFQPISIHFTIYNYPKKNSQIYFTLTIIQCLIESDFYCKTSKLNIFFCDLDNMSCHIWNSGSFKIHSMMGGSVYDDSGGGGYGPPCSSYRPWQKTHKQLLIIVWYIYRS